MQTKDLQFFIPSVTVCHTLDHPAFLMHDINPVLGRGCELYSVIQALASKHLINKLIPFRKSHFSD